MTKEIQLTQGKVTLVDDDDFEYLNQFSWSFSNGYARRVTQRPEMKTIYMHREILGFPNQLIDHADLDKLNNQKSNLRLCDHSQNQANRNIVSFGVSKRKGVFRNGKNWGARINVRGEHINLGTFSSIDLAAQAYDNAAKKHFGEFAKVSQ